MYEYGKARKKIIILLIIFFLLNSITAFFTIPLTYFIYLSLANKTIGRYEDIKEKAKKATTWGWAMGAIGGGVFIFGADIYQRQADPTSHGAFSGMDGLIVPFIPIIGGAIAAILFHAHIVTKELDEKQKNSLTSITNTNQDPENQIPFQQ